MDPKLCFFCGVEYYPRSSQSRQKYCSRSCKDKQAWKRYKDTGDIRRRKGGYNRLTYISVWLKQVDLSVPCYYCKTRLFPEDKWVLDHMKPLSSLSTREEMQSKDNLCIACVSCNVKKGSTPLKDFLKQIKKNG